MDRILLPEPIANWPLKKVNQTLEILGDDPIGHSNETDTGAFSFGLSSIFGRPSYMQKGSIVGFIEDNSVTDNGIAIISATTMSPQEELKGKKLNVRFDGYRLARYPGTGMHDILFNFKASHIVNSELNESELVSYNMSFQGRDSTSIPIIGYPIFLDLNVGDTALILEGYSVNIASSGDQIALQYLNSKAFATGLKLVGSFNPLVAQVSTISSALVQSIAEHSKNQPVQSFKYGFDLSPSSLGLKLRSGTYIIAQIPDELIDDWDWTQWSFNPDGRKLVFNDENEEIESLDFNTALLRIELAQ